MGMCKPSGGVKVLKGKYGRSIKEVVSTPNSRIDYYDEDTGELLQQRWYDSSGKAMLDRDWKHYDPNNTHKFPHDHIWDWTKKTPRQVASNVINNDYN